MESVGAQQQKGPVLLGITGSGENRGALLFAADEARRLDQAVRLVHAVHHVVPPPPGGILVSYQRLDEVAEVVLSDVRHELAELAGDVRVETVARLGRPVDVLVGLSETASILVLQHRERARLGRIVTGSTSVGVALRAHCPVVSIPDGWSPDGFDRVVVGVDEFGGPAHVLQRAFAEAAARGAALTVVHAWRLDRPYADLVTAGDEWQGWLPRARRHLEDATAPWRVGHPGMDVAVEVQHEWSAEALVDASRVSDLLVLGRRSGRSPRFTLGSLARTLIGHAVCPVEVVPEPEDGEDRDDPEGGGT